MTGAGPARSSDAEAVLPRGFFDDPALQVAPRLLGCVLRHDSRDGPVSLVITEVEAYAGPDDPASHAYRGQTARNAVMFGPPGYVYVYFTYGMHFCANLVCQPPGSVSAILLRAGRIIDGADLAAARRWPQPAADSASPAARSSPAAPGGPSSPVAPSGPSSPVAPSGPSSPATPASPADPAGPRRVAPRDLAGGPARLCQALGIDRALNGADACDPASPLRVLVAPPGAALAGPVCSGPRIGISQAADRPWRFWLAGEPSVTRYRVFTPRRRSR
jgi:DNA-3-methyladenine glycosylase